MANKELTRGQHLLKAIGLGSLIKPEQKKMFQQAVLTTTIGISPKWYDEVFSNGINSYQNSAIVYSIVNKVTKMAAIPQFKVFRVKDQKKWYKYKAFTGENATQESILRAIQMKEFVYEEDNDHDLNRLIDKPNGFQKGNEFTIASIANKLLTGNRFLYVNVLDAGADRGRPQELHNMPPLEMEVLSDGTIYGVRGYRFVMGMEKIDIPIEAIIHSKYFNPNVDSSGSHLLGQSPLSAGRKNLTRIDSALGRSVAMLQNAGAAGMLFEKEAPERSLEQVNELRNKINSRINGTDNSGAVSYFAGDMGYINFGIPASDMELLATEKYSTQNICNIFGYPPGAFDPDKATYANSKEFNKQIITGCVIPELASLRDDWNEIAKLYKGDGIYVDYDLSVYPELQEDIEKMVAALVPAWWFTGNERRLKMGEDEDIVEPMMNKYFIPSSLVPIDSAGDNLGNMLEGLDGEEDVI